MGSLGLGVSSSSNSISTSASESVFSSFGVTCLYFSLVLGLQYDFGFLCSFSVYVPNVNCIVSGDVDCSLGSLLLAFRDSFADRFSKHLTVSLTGIGACFSFWGRLGWVADKFELHYF